MCLLMLALSLQLGITLAQDYVSDIPSGFNASQWAWISYQNPSASVLPGSFNRSVFDAPFESTTSDSSLTQINNFLNTTDFVAYDDKFFDIIGPNAAVDHVQYLAFQSHEAACYNPDAKELFFVEWGPPGGLAGEHSWQYILDTKTNVLRNVTTNPPTTNVHGCVFYRGAMYVVTDGSHQETGTLVRIDPGSLNKTVLLNNYYQQPFMGFNDLDIDPEGNFWLTDSKAAYGRDLTEFYPPTNPTVYMVNGTTMRPKVVHITTGNANGVAVSAPSDGPRQLYLPDTGVSTFKPVSLKDPYGDRRLTAYNIAAEGGVLSNPRLLNNPISYFYDGIRVSRNGYIFAGAGDGVDVIDPVTGLTLGTIRVGGGENLAVTLAFGEHELWIVGRGGVWHPEHILGLELEKLGRVRHELNVVDSGQQHNTEMASPRALEALRKFTTCDIGDALVKLKYPYGGFLDGIKMFSPGATGRVFGPAITVQMVEMSDTSAPKLDKHFVDHNEDGSIMYIQQPKGLPSACWGGLMSTRAKFLGAQAVVIDGRMRDVNEHREMGFPVFARGNSILGSNTFTRASRVNVPLQYKNDLWINPGDLMIADEDGVVVTPPSLVEQVVALCQERAEIDEKMFVELRKGGAMGELIKSLRKEK